MVKWKFTIDKPLGVICPGHSIYEFIPRWKDELSYLDIAWVAMNDCNHLRDIKGLELEIYIKYTATGCGKHGSKYYLQEAQARGNSLLEFIFQCEENGVKDLILFGADGYSDVSGKPYMYGSGGRNAENENHRRECEHFNNNYPKDLKMNVYNVVTDIGSHYEHIKKITYEEFFNHFPNKK